MSNILRGCNIDLHRDLMRFRFNKNKLYQFFTKQYFDLKYKILFLLNKIQAKQLF
jgi:hypothetical protein